VLDSVVTPVAAPQRRADPTGSSERVLLRLQRTAGNAAVAALLAKPSTEAKSVAKQSVGPSVQRIRLATAMTGMLAGPAASLPVAQRDLAGDIKSRVDIIGPPDYNGLIALIRAASVADRQAVLADTAIMHLLGSRLAPQWATTLASALLEGTKKWKNPVDNDFFNFFVYGTGPGPANPSSTMNCWESIMYAAYLAGVVNAAWIKSFYKAALAQPDANAAAYALLGWSTTLPTYNPAAGRVPTTGQLVFYQTAGSSVPGHVAVYMGNGQIMSLWTQPAGIDHIQQVSITSIAGIITFRDPPW
jgi:hypothetical protein